MKRIFVVLTAIAFIACNNEKAAETPAETDAKAHVPANLHGFTPQYSVSFVMDSAKNTETVLNLWRAWVDGNLSTVRSHFADSVSFFLPDGSRMIGQTDTILGGMQAYRSSFKTVDSKVDAAFAVKSTDKNENWVAIWGIDISTDMKGKVDTTSLMETWRFNKDGKVDMMFQASPKGMLPPPPPGK